MTKYLDLSDLYFIFTKNIRLWTPYLTPHMDFICMSIY